MTEEKFREIYHQYYYLVKNVVYSVLKDSDFSEDICQEVFLLFLKKEETLDEAYYRQWFLVNAKRKAIDFCRKSYREHETLTTLHSPETKSSQETVLDWIILKRENNGFLEDEIAHKMVLRELVEKLFKDLEKKDREWYEIVVRMQINGESAKETAKALGITVGNLKVKKHRIKEWVNKNYRKDFKEE